MIQLAFLLVFYVLFIIAFFACTLLFILYVLQQWFHIKVPTIRTGKKDLATFLSEGHIKDTDIVYDLGSGNGESIFMIETITGAKTYGLELGISAFLVSSVIKRIYRYKTTLQFKNIYTADISKATVVYGYLFPAIVATLEKDIASRLTPGTKIILCDFKFPNMTPDTVTKYTKHTFYSYTV